MNWQLRDAVTGTVITIDSRVTTYRNDPVRVLAFTPPKTELSGLGRVQIERIVELKDGTKDVHIETVMPSVIGAKFVSDGLDTIPRGSLITINLPEEE